ncbi:MAG: hypothetical protein GYB67_06335 [Chloroflexi bacterium]|nr:hypothetical protein [Chloroflexota bacterium]
MISALVCLILSACAAQTTETPLRVALLAPFEGRYRELGYNALYAARLAFSDAASPTNVTLLPIDDGGTVASAADRARALAQDPLVMIALALGPFAAAPETQHAFADTPMLIVGHWADQPPTRDTVYLLTNPAIDDMITVDPAALPTDAPITGPIIGADLFALPQIPALAGQALDQITVVSSGALPDPEFAERYRSSDPFAPEPGPLASLTYDATRLAIQAIGTPLCVLARAPDAAIAAAAHSGYNGPMRFADGYWQDAPLYRYRYTPDGTLIRVDGRTIE